MTSPDSISENDLSLYQTVLASHPLVKRAEISADGGSSIPLAKIWLAPEAWNISSSLNREFMNKWRYVYDASYQRSPQEPTFDIGIWKDSYDGRPIPSEEMQAWTNEAVDRILRLGARDIVEIGCGSGLLLYRVAPRCNTYVGYDYAKSVVERLKADIDQRGSAVGNVRVETDDAEVLKKWPDHSVDLVVMNSVIMYFPSENYLENILHEAVRIVRPTGHIFIGDVRDRRLLELFCLDVEIASIDADATPQEIRARADRRLNSENQLLVCPDFFVSFRRAHPTVTGLKVELKSSSFQNEMTRFRYDVTIRVGYDAFPAMNDTSKAERALVATENVNLADILLEVERTSAPLQICGIQNARIAALHSIWSKILPDKNIVSDLASLRKVGVDPYDLASALAARQMRICCSPSANFGVDRFDATIWKSGQVDPSCIWNYTSSGTSTSQRWNGLPAQLRTSQERLIAKALTEYLNSAIPQDAHLPQLLLMNEDLGESD